MKPIGWEYRKGYSVHGVDADAVGAELLRIRTEKGALITHDVIDEARPVDAQLHAVFEWDDSKAAERHREQQARELIRSVRVIYAQGESSEQAFVNVRVEREDAVDQHYELSRLVVADDDLWESAKSAAHGRINAAKSMLGELVVIAERAQVPKKVRTARKALGKVEEAARALG